MVVECETVVHARDIYHSRNHSQWVWAGWHVFGCHACIAKQGKHAGSSLRRIRQREVRLPGQFSLTPLLRGVVAEPMVGKVFACPPCFAMRAWHTFFLQS